MKSTLLAAALAVSTFSGVFGIGSMVVAQGAASLRTDQTTKALVLDDTAINTACVANPTADDTPSCASFEVPTAGWECISLLIDYTYSAATDVKIYMDTSMDGDIPWFETTYPDASALPTVDLPAPAYKFDVTADRAKDVMFCNLNAPFTRFRIVGTSADASDLVDVTYVLKGGR